MNPKTIDFYSFFKDTEFLTTDHFYFERLGTCEAHYIFSDVRRDDGYCDQPAVMVAVRASDGKRVNLCVGHLIRFLNSLEVMMDAST